MFLAMLPKLQAEAELREIRMLAAAGGTMKDAERRRYMSRLFATAFPERHQLRTFEDLRRAGIPVEVREVRRG